MAYVVIFFISWDKKWSTCLLSFALKLDLKFMTGDGIEDTYSNMAFKSYLSWEHGVAFLSWQAWLFTTWALSRNWYV